jgi:hypothetical protein
VCGFGRFVLANKKSPGLLATDFLFFASGSSIAAACQHYASRAQ